MQHGLFHERTFCNDSPKHLNLNVCFAVKLEEFPPPVNRQIHSTENIIFPQLRWQAVKKQLLTQPYRKKLIGDKVQIWKLNMKCIQILNFSKRHVLITGMCMSHFAYACKMRYPLNLVLESWEYLWFY